MAKYTVVCLFFLVLADKVLNLLDLLATTFPGKENRRDFRTLAMDLRRDPTLNNLDRSAFMLFIWSSSKIFDVFMWCIFRKERTLNFRCITLRPLGSYGLSIRVVQHYCSLSQVLALTGGTAVLTISRSDPSLQFKNSIGQQRTSRKERKGRRTTSQMAYGLCSTSSAYPRRLRGKALMILWREFTRLLRISSGT